MSEPPVDISADAVEVMLGTLYGHPEAQAMLRAMKRERGELRQRVLEAEKAARVTLEQAERAGPCFKSILLREALVQAEAKLAQVREPAGESVAMIDANKLREAEALQMVVWRPMAEAPRDGTVILVLFRADLAERTGRADLARWEGRYGAVRWHGNAGEWGLATPVGVAGLPDEWMVGWRAIYPTRREPVR